MALRGESSVAGGALTPNSRQRITRELLQTAQRPKGLTAMTFCNRRGKDLCRRLGGRTKFVRLPRQRLTFPAANVRIAREMGQTKMDKYELEDILDDDEVEAIEQAQIDAKREKTPYGRLVESDDE